MTKSELVRRMAELHPHLQHSDIERVVETIFTSIGEALTRRDRIEIRGFGTFSVKHRSARLGKNPRTGAIRGYVGVLLAVALSLCGLSWTAPASAQQIVVQGANVDPSTLKPYFTGTDSASVERGVEDLRATGIYSNVSAKVENGKIVVSLAGGSQIINRVAFEGNKQIETKQLEVEVQSKPHTAYNEATADARRRQDQGRL